MKIINYAIFMISGMLLFLGIFSKKISKLYISRIFIFLVAGIVVSFLFHHLVIIPASIRAVFYEDTSRIVLTLGLMGTALQLPEGILRLRAKNLSILLTMGMFGMWIVSTVLIYGIIGASFLTSLLIGAIITPTDPILARSVLESTFADGHISVRIRNTLLAESALNDGLAFPFVMFSIALLTQKNLFIFWGLYVVLFAVIGGSLTGFCIGYVAGILVRWSQQKNLIQFSYVVGFAFLLALFSVMLGNILHMDGLLTVFFTGIGFKQTRVFHEEEALFQKTTNSIFTPPLFFLFGLILPWQSWFALGWKAILLVICIALFRRIPVILLVRRLLAPAVATWQEGLFAGWFGPIGVSALFYSTYSFVQTGMPEIFPVTSLLITASIAIYGISSIPITKFWFTILKKKR